MPLSNSQFDTIMSEYEAKRRLHARELNKKEEKAYEDFPRLREIDEQAASLSMKKVRIRLHASNDPDFDLDELLDDLALEKKALLTRAGFRNGVAEPQYDCPICRDTGFVNGIKCACFKKAESELLYRSSNIGEQIKKENFSTFSLQVYSDSVKDPDTGRSARDFASAAYERAVEFAQNFDSSHANLCLTGKTGTGKTFLAHCIAGAAIDRGQNVLFLPAHTLFDMLSDNRFRHSDETAAVCENIYNCDLLIIDDLGSSMTNSFVVSELFNVIEERYINNKSVVITTNLSLNELRDAYSDRIYSRLASYYETLYLFGEDIRLK